MSIRDSARIAALEARVSELTARVESLEALGRAQDRKQGIDRSASAKTRKGHR